MLEAFNQDVTHSCPKCGSDRVHRSRRWMFERWLGRLFTDQRMYRCNHCRHRFRDNKRGSSRYVSSISDLAVVGSSVSTSQDSPTHTSGSKRKRRHRNKSQDEPSAFRRFQVWLYRKHGLTVGMLVLFMILAVGGLVFLSWALDRWG